MPIADYFRKPIKTWCEIQGVEHDVTVTADYQPPESCAAEYVEACEVRDATGKDRLDDMLVAEKWSLEDRLLEMAYSRRDASCDDLRVIAREEQAIELAVLANQRGIGR